MAMLAEPRKKQRIGPNPRGKFFQDDQDNVGRQMLMKMGWKTGDGLGATSQGMSEPIKPKIHTDARGLGFDKTKDPWVAHNEEFEELLKNLNAQSGDDNEEVKKTKPLVESSEEDSMSGGLETKSKSSRARIHYHKFVKNKDLSRASTKDFSCIFGKAVSEIDNSLLRNPDTKYSDDNADVEAEKNSFKWELKTKFESNEPSTEAGDGVECVDESSSEKRKKKKKKRSKEKENEAIEIETEDVTEIQQEDQEDIVPSENLEVKTKKKKKWKHRIETENEVEENVEESATQTLEDTIIPSELENVKKRKKSKKQKHSKDEDQSNNDSVAVDVADSTFEPVQKEITDGVESNEDVNIQLPSLEDVIPDNSSEEGSVKKRKKSKKRKHTADEDQIEKVEEAEAMICEDVEEEQPPKKKRKRRKNKEESNDSDELLTTENVPDTGMEASAPAEPKQDEPPKNDNVESFGSLQFINRGSIEDYFRTKRLEMLNRLKAKANASE